MPPLREYLCRFQAKPPARFEAGFLIESLTYALTEDWSLDDEYDS